MMPKNNKRRPKGGWREAARRQREYEATLNARVDVARHREELAHEDWPYPDDFWRVIHSNER
jgi:hypothetical protein